MSYNCTDVQKKAKLDQAAAHLETDGVQCRFHQAACKHARTAPKGSLMALSFDYALLHTHVHHRQSAASTSKPVANLNYLASIMKVFFENNTHTL